MPLHSKVSDQTGQMLRLILVFAGRKAHIVGFFRVKVFILLIFRVLELKWVLRTSD